MESSYLFLNDIRLHYLHWNNDGDGQPVILLHGLASNARIWQKAAPLLAEAGFSVFAPDQRGHGLTDKPDGLYDFDTFSLDLLAFIDACHLERPLLVGHSWGASVVLDYAARRSIGPSAPPGIVLLDGGMNQLADGPGSDWETTRRRLEPPRLAGTPLWRFLDRISAPGQKWTPDEESTAIILANFEVDADETIAPHLSYDHHMQIVRAMWEFPTFARFARLRCPVLLLPCSNPPPLSEGELAYLEVKRKGVERILAETPRAEVHWLEDTIHDAPLQRPEAVAGEIVAFAEKIKKEGNRG
jgi:pimeloyl-ACP methyl ester carboxylesterase